MKKITVTLILFILLIPAFTLSAYDQIWGARLDLNLELPEMSSSTFALKTEDVARFWYRGSWSQAANMEADAGVTFDANAVFGLTTDIKFSFHGLYYSVYPMLDKLNFYGQSGIYGYKAGRQVFVDPAGLIIDDPADGLDFNVNLGAHVVSGGAAYTGLAFRESSDYYMTETDVKRDSLLAAPRVFEFLSWSLPGATPWLNPSAYFLALQDLTGADDLTANGNERFNSLYLELMTQGFLGEAFLYDLALVGQYGIYDDATSIGGIARLGLSWLPGKASRIGVDLIGSTGDDWNRGGYLLGTTTEIELNQYLPVSTVSTQGYVVEFELGNLTSLGAFYANRPSNTFSWEFRATTFLRSAIGPVSTALVPNSSSESHFLGQEGLFSFFWRPKSDFGWDMKVGVLYPGDPIVLDSEIEPYFPVLFRLGFDWSWSF